MNTLETYKLNKSTILAVLRAAGATTATVTYAGVGDDGGIEDMIIEGLPDQSTVAQILAASVMETVESYPWNPQTRSRPDVPVVSTQEIRVDMALENLMWDAIELAGHGGWENGAGGGGEFILDVAGGTSTLDHYDNYTEELHYSWSEQSAEQALEGVL